MNNHLVESKLTIQNITLTVIMIILLMLGMLLGFYFLRVSDPYIQSVLSIKGDETRGQAIFQVNCTGCHGQNGIGNLGPSLKNVSKHKSNISLINQVIKGKTPPMPKFQPSPQDMADLLSYLQQL